MDIRLHKCCTCITRAENMADDAVEYPPLCDYTLASRIWKDTVVWQNGRVTDRMELPTEEMLKDESYLKVLEDMNETEPVGFRSESELSRSKKACPNSPQSKITPDVSIPCVYIF